MKQTKRCIAQFTFYDRTGIQAFLEKQARQGWRLEKLSRWGWKFRRIEPTNLHYAVTYFPRASQFDAEPTEDQQHMQALCEHTGWTLVDRDAQLQIFCHEPVEDGAPVPIETDAALELDNIHQAVKKSYIPSYCLLLLLAFYQGFGFVQDVLRRPLETLSSNGALFIPVMVLTLLLMCVMELGGYFLWRRKALRQLAMDGGFVATRSSRSLMLAMLWLVLAAFVLMLTTVSPVYTRVMLIYLAGIMVLSALVRGVTLLGKRRGWEADANRFLTFAAVIVGAIALVTVLVHLPEAVFADEEDRMHQRYAQQPLHLSDFCDMADVESDYSLTESSSVLLSRSRLMEHSRTADSTPSMICIVVDVKLPPLYDFCRDALLDDVPREPLNDPEDGGESIYERYLPVDPQPWSAQAAYRLHWNDQPATGEDYILCYEDRIVSLLLGLIPTEEQKAAIGERLR